MDETRNKEPALNQPVATTADAGHEGSLPASGMEVNLGDFTRTQGLMKSLRLTLDSQVVVQVEEIASGVNEAGRKFKMGDIVQANLDVARLYATFGQRTAQWENQARNLEQQMKSQAAKNPKSVSIEKMNRMKAEQTAVRGRIRIADVHFRRLHQGLDQAFTNLQRQPAGAGGAMPADVPAGFLAAFQAAGTAKRPAIVREHFDTGAVFKVSVKKGAEGAYDVRFDPVPPLGRLYFFSAAAQVVRLEQLGDTVVVHDVERGQKSEMRLVEFVKQVQIGVWLLQPRRTA